MGFSTLEAVAIKAIAFGKCRLDFFVTPTRLALTGYGFWLFIPYCRGYCKRRPDKL